jgi:15-cis-phytoene desaturase
MSLFCHRISQFSQLLTIIPLVLSFACPGRNKYRPGQRTPIPNLTMAGDWTSQKFLGSMEGAILGGKLAAEVLAKKAKGLELPAEKEIQQHIVDTAASFEPKEPIGIKGDGAIAFGGGSTFTTKSEELLKKSDPAQFAA